MKLLDSELWHLDAEEVVFQVAFREQDFRLDGDLRANARRQHPGVIVSFDSRFGPLQYACDAFTNYEANVRAVALGLEALRRVDRYGITKRGEQYTGYRQLGAGIAMPSSADAQMTIHEAAGFIFMMSGSSLEPSLLITDAAQRDVCYRHAAKRLHPDAGGSTAEFQKLQEAKRILDSAS